MFEKHARCETALDFGSEFALYFESHCRFIPEVFMQIYDILKREHDEVKALINDLVSLRNDDEYRFVLVEEIKNALIPHSRAEEAAFYNTLRAVDADKSIVAHGFQEHMEAEALLRLLEAKDKVNFDWKATAIKLQEALKHHITEEETKIFAEARQMFNAEEAETIGKTFLELKPKYVNDGAFKSAAEFVLNALPLRLANSIRGFDSTKH
jgi:hemerythrin-like domain-containing protein